MQQLYYGMKGTMSDPGLYFDVDYLTTSLSAIDLKTKLCDNDYLVMAGYTTSEPGHVVVAYGYETAVPPQPYPMVYFMDPSLGHYEDYPYPVFRDMYLGWKESIVVKYYDPPDVPISDIRYFLIREQWPSDEGTTPLDFKLSADADPQIAALYVSDNPMGPARLFAVEEDILVEPYENTVLDYRREGYASYYYYYMDYSYGPFPELRPTVEVWGAQNNPRFLDGFDNRPEFDAPSNPTVSDVALDRGGGAEGSLGAFRR